MKLPPLPEPAMVYVNGTHEITRCYNETQLIEYGKACAEAMREACAAECDSERNRWTFEKVEYALEDCAKAIRALEIENAGIYTSATGCVNDIEGVPV